ncbi:energy-coupling factor ABC transporter ATP-binding protein [Tropicimonas sp. IMCC34043]|uniref:energy-coupling factor ABC transporter ATP-binding protein n=1 Tax=Tropicimonas sp. IMCC34043 TaxID=2248760 RepID=UPI001300745D|nr:energy-coupling factor ABC transporter ATP-binding protein [Tropicimonas sp. IMCC34043]
MALIEVDNLTFGYEPDAPVLDGITLEIAEGERIAILGGNGSGKSTLAQWIAGWLPRGAHKASQGEVRVNGTTWQGLDARTRTETVQFVGQVPMQQLSGFAFTVWDEIVFGPGNLGLPPDEIVARAERAVAMCNLAHLLERDPFSLSGGEQQRLSIAAALAMQPRALVLDEPTGNFDPESRDILLAQMADLPGGLTTIWCDVALGPPLVVADRFLLLDEARIVFDGDARAFLAHPRTRDIFGLPAVAEVAALLAKAGRWPGGILPPFDLDEAVAAFGAVMEGTIPA